MNVFQISEKAGFKLLTSENGSDRDVKGFYTCDLLSWVIGRAKEDQLWFTVMGNINSVAVATLMDVSGIVLTENATLDEDAKLRAEQQGVAIYSTELDSATALIKVHEILE